MTTRHLRNDKIFSFVVFFILSLIGIVIYSSAVKGGFIWDDEYLVENNYYIKDLKNFGKIFTTDFGAGGGKRYGFYRPFQNISYAIDYSLWKLDTRGYHLVSITLHILTAFMVFVLVWLIFKDRALGFLTSILFLVHPVHTEAVAYISGRGDPLGIFLMFSSVFMYIRLTEGNFNFLYFTGMIIAYLLALFTKESVVVLPFLLLLYHYTVNRPVRWGYFFSFIGVFFAYLVFRVMLAPSAQPDLALSAGLVQRIPGCFVAFFNYLKLLIFPFGLHFEYGNPVFQMTDIRAVAGFALFVGAIVAVIWMRKKKVIFFSILWFLICFLPFSNLYHLPFYMAEHYLYLSSIGVFILVAGGFLYAIRQKKFRLVGISIFALITIFLSVLTFRQNFYWRDNISFHEKTLKYAPDSFRFHNDLGRLYLLNGRVLDAFDQFQEVIRLDPSNPYPFNNIGVMYNDKKHYQKAIPYFIAAVKRYPQYSDAWNNLGVAFAGTDQIDKAIDAYKKAIEARPDFAGAYTNLGNALTGAGRYEEAIGNYNQAIAFDPYDMSGYYNLSVCFEKMNRSSDALRIVRQGLAAIPDSAPLHFRLSLLYYFQGDYAKAIAQADEAVRLGMVLSDNYKQALDLHRD